MAVAGEPAVERRRLRIRGTVQGVGFRPFVDRLAREHGIGGFVRNDSAGVVVEAEADAATLDRFVTGLRERAPTAARIDSIQSRRLATPLGDPFRIAASARGERGRPAVVGPDLATCDECLRELFDPADRRHRYPFLNCTACGPRLTITERVPYDRRHTTLADFTLCEACAAEYADPGDRRYHAEAIACPDCGPRLRFEAGGEPAFAAEALAGAERLLGARAIVAVKGLGGYHLACDATDEGAVRRLRAAKHRERKPFALMVGDPALVGKPDPEELELLRSPERPIVLVRRDEGSDVAAAVAPGGNPWLGVMLPYTPLHHLLIADLARPLVMTSANRSDEPIAITDADARRRLAGIADAFLTHDRRIHRRCEDSVVRAAHPLRRSRGYAPAPLRLPRRSPRAVIAAGAELKATFCIVRGDRAYLSPHLGDLDGPLARDAFAADLRLYTEMLAVEPELLACDLHPDFFTTRWAERTREQQRQRGRECELVRVQHHHAHAAACLAEHGRTDPALALVFDGTGLGPEGTLWGGELLRCDLAGYERVTHLEPVPLPGGERAIREPWRVAAAALERAGRPVPERWTERWALVRQSLAVNAPRSSGMGRLFDAVSALLGVCERVDYEGQAAIELEWLAGTTAAEPYRCAAGPGPIPGSELVAAAFDDLAAGRERSEIAAAFHEGVALTAADACAAAGEPRAVVLSGGTFQNRRLLAATTRRLANLGFEVLSHRRVPPNDGGISFGQAAVAVATSGRRDAPCA